MFYASKTFGFLYYLGDRFLQTMMAISDGNDIHIYVDSYAFRSSSICLAITSKLVVGSKRATT